MFPTIAHINDVRSMMEQFPEFGIVKQDNGYQVISYFIATPDSFSNPITREFRGITFDEKGVIASRPLHKFFNVGERESTQSHVLEWDKVTRVMDKRDGSMINPVLVNGKIMLKTKRSFVSDVAKAAQKYFDTQKSLQDFSRAMTEAGYSPTFEYTSPSNRIVLSYDAEELVLLHVRQNVSGEYFTKNQLEDVAKEFGIKLVDTIPLDDHMSLLESMKTLSGIEGFVVQFESGEMVKMKTEEYIQHHRMVTFVRERDIVEMILDEKIDDVKSAFKERGLDQSKIEAIEVRVVNILNDLRKHVEGVYETNKHLGRKEFVEAIKNVDNFKLVMQHYSFMNPVPGRVVAPTEPNYVGHFRANILKQEFGLDPV